MASAAAAMADNDVYSEEDALAVQGRQLAVHMIVKEKTIQSLIKKHQDKFEILSESEREMTYRWKNNAIDSICGVWRTEVTDESEEVYRAHQQQRVKVALKGGHFPPLSVELIKDGNNPVRKYHNETEGLQEELCFGLFAEGEVEKGTVLGAYTGQLREDNAANRDAWMQDIYAFDFEDGGTFIDGMHFANKLSFVNDKKGHPDGAYNCEFFTYCLPAPNAKGTSNSKEASNSKKELGCHSIFQIVLIAMKNIQPGAELITNYGDTYWTAQKKNAEFMQVSRKLKDRDKMIEELQKKVRKAKKQREEDSQLRSRITKERAAKVHKLEQKLKQRHTKVGELRTRLNYQNEKNKFLTDKLDSARKGAAESQAKLEKEMLSKEEKEKNQKERFELRIALQKQEIASLKEVQTLNEQKILQLEESATLAQTLADEHNGEVADLQSQRKADAAMEEASESLIINMMKSLNLGEQERKETKEREKARREMEELKTKLYKSYQVEQQLRRRNAALESENVNLQYNNKVEQKKVTILKENRKAEKAKEEAKPMRVTCPFQGFKCQHPCGATFKNWSQLDSHLYVPVRGKNAPGKYKTGKQRQKWLTETQAKRKLRSPVRCNENKKWIDCNCKCDSFASYIKQNINKEGKYTGTAYALCKYYRCHWIKVKSRKNPYPSQEDVDAKLEEHYKICDHVNDTVGGQRGLREKQKEQQQQMDREQEAALRIDAENRLADEGINRTSSFTATATNSTHNNNSTDSEQMYDPATATPWPKEEPQAWGTHGSNANSTSSRSSRRSGNGNGYERYDSYNDRDRKRSKTSHYGRRNGGLPHRDDGRYVHNNRDRPGNHAAANTIWKAHYDAKSGRYYYHNLETKETTWDRPPALQNNDRDRGRGRERERDRDLGDRKRYWDSSK